jgi:uncharacterized protein (TIGR02186 family)
MLRNTFALLIALILATAPLRAETVVAGLSQADVLITADFDGSNILIFGAVRRDAPPPEGAPLEVVITVQGPPRPVTVRRKERRLGIWVNTEAVEITRAPSFYAIAATGPIDAVLSPEEDRRFRVTIPRAIGPAAPLAPGQSGSIHPAIGQPAQTDEAQAFIDAMIRIRTGSGAYQATPGGVGFEEATLFRSEFALPANLTEGLYRSRIFLTRDGEVVDVLVKDISVRKVGLERWLYHLSRREPLIYGLLSVALAVLAGWGASSAFRYLRS